MKRRTRNAKVQFCLLGLILLTITTGALAQTGAGPRDAGRSLGSVSGRVLDQRGDSIGGARVNALGQANWPSLGTGQMTTTDGNGNFRLSLSQGQYELRVTASGFASQTRRLEVGESPLQIQVTLEPGRFAEELTVTPARTEIRMSEAPASVSVLDSQDVTRAGAQTIDDLLRQVPGFSIFRRSSSLVANPTTQGVSLRGAGASGASRTLVLTDGVPLNDAFGGWVYWDRVARTSIDRVELVRGGASDLYGSDALSGVINVLTRPPSQSVVNAEASYGARDTSDVSFFASQPWKGVGVAVSGEALRTDGYFIIAPELRGRADERAGSRHRLLNLRLDHNWKTDQSVFIRGSLFDEDRQNGTQLQRNDTATESVAVGGRWKTPDGSLWNLALFANQQRFHQSFTAVAADRNTETLTRLQFVPSRDAGFSFNWSRAGLDKHLLVAGIDLRGVRGTSDELVYVTGRPSSVVSAGGRQRRLGFFAQDLFSLSARWQLALSARYDNWRDSSAASVTRSLATGLVQPQFFAPHSAGAFSPRLSVIFRPQERLALRAAVYRAFRAPTLNELYRAFRVGDTLTLANQNLTAERLTGGEIGGTWNPSRKTSVRLTGYWTEIVNPISNFTVSVTPTLITRQRRNLGRTQSAGLEAETEFRLTNYWSLTGGYLFADATVRRAPQDRSLEGLWVPQVPRHQFTLQTAYSHPKYLAAAIQFRASGRQFDDDQNRLPLGRFALVDATVARRLTRHFELFFGVQNLFNERYAVGRTPLETLGMPRMARGGIRLKLEK